MYDLYVYMYIRYIRAAYVYPLYFIIFLAPVRRFLCRGWRAIASQFLVVASLFEGPPSSPCVARFSSSKKKHALSSRGELQLNPSHLSSFISSSRCAHSVKVAECLGESHDFVSSLPLEQYGPCVTTAVEDECELRRVTDNFSIAALKVAQTRIYYLNNSKNYRVCIWRLMFREWRHFAVRSFPSSPKLWDFAV